MELTLNKISADLRIDGSYLIELSCAFKRGTNGALSPHFGHINIALSKEVVTGLTLEGIEAAAVAEARRLIL